MYGYRLSQDDGLIANLDSISSSLSSIDTLGRRRTNVKVANSSSDQLIVPRTHSVASNSLIWKPHTNDDRSTIYSNSHLGRTNGSILSRQNGSDIYYNGSIMAASNSNQVSASTRATGNPLRPNQATYHKHPSKHSSTCCCCCFSSGNSINLLMYPLLILTILRQTIDFMGQIWLQIIINFFTIIIIIVALFGVRQQSISYLLLFITWSLFNVTWNTLVFCVYSKIRDVGIPDELLSFYTGATSWWRTNGPGCLPYNISSLHATSISLLKQSNVIPGCRIDYRLIEAAQALVHGALSFFALLACSCLITNIRRNPGYYKNYLNNSRKTDKAYKMNNLTNIHRQKVNQDLYANPSSSSVSGRPINTNSLRRAPNKTSSRSSQHSVSSRRSTSHRNQSNSTNPINNMMPGPRLSTSSTMRSQKYGSISSRRSASRKERRGDMASLTYGTIGSNGERIGDIREAPNGSSSRRGDRDRLSSVSSVDYLPSYQPPHSSSANLLSSYGEISSVDSYNNPAGQESRRRAKHTKAKTVLEGSMNPNYSGSRSSISSRNNHTISNGNPNGNNNNNYDDINYIYARNGPLASGPGSTHTFENRSHHRASGGGPEGPGSKSKQANGLHSGQALYGTGQSNGSQMRHHPNGSVALGSTQGGTHSSGGGGNSETPI